MKQTLDLVQSLDVSVGYRRLRSARRRRRRPALVFDQVFDGSDRRALELIDYNGSGVVTDAVDVAQLLKVSVFDASAVASTLSLSPYLHT